MDKPDFFAMNMPTFLRRWTPDPTQPTLDRKAGLKRMAERALSKSAQADAPPQAGYRLGETSAQFVVRVDAQLNETSDYFSGRAGIDQ